MTTEIRLLVTGGGYGQRISGGNYAAIFDGVSAGGKVAFNYSPIILSLMSSMKPL